MTSSSLVLGVVAHVDAGKTSLTERLLYDAGAVASLGSVDAGTTQTDASDLERRRGITIRASVATLALGDVAVTIVDTPGHPDFVAEVERSLAILDAAVLVVSAVEGVQPQTVVLWRALRRLGVPTLVLVNKVDRSGADLERTVLQVRRRLTADVVVLSHVRGIGRGDVVVEAVPGTDPLLVEAAASLDDDLLARWVDGATITPEEVAAALRAGVRRGALTPVLAGSAITGAGIDRVRDAITDLLAPAPASDGPGAGTVFAIDRDERGRRAWVRWWSGELRLRERIAPDGKRPAPVTEIAVSRPGGLERSRVVRAGEVAAVRGLDVRIGDALGTAAGRGTYRFPPPTLEAVVEPCAAAQRIAMFRGLVELAEEDPLIDLRVDEEEGEAVVRLHGEVQKEVLAAMLDARYGVPVRFSETSAVCIERVVGTGEALDEIEVDANPYLATIGLRVEPGARGSGVAFSPGVERGNLPPAFIAATEDGVRAALRHGLAGWEVTDCLVTMTRSGYWPRQSHAHEAFNKAMSSVATDFRSLAPVVLAAALERAGTQVCRPIDRFEIDLPEDTLGAVLSLVGQLGGKTTGTLPKDGFTVLTGHLPSAAVPELAQRLPDLTGGEAVLAAELDHYAPVPRGTAAPRRARTGADPRDRTEWFRSVRR
ncbi:elongation factor G [Mumia zhuanghuii]|uniref:TetM/TetW/TetO/TetS family tetracycline resistance ribosomal protection protein n=1 Tax=Mumia zhuanghuii TaxID=2585211 RepID=A0A5C4MDZ1_9ACTN|nr:TetM/TetW/TetO/TetS family tetracycline resistance ribosomal protection protein [Mumia zhuanghuii]TNC35681.1 TetM/TetW/TetO/TetS family tetracycline resistance ribosomal protection protein [Mumia zhuanghuii]TNC51702.1 TetM/TetW/TetO/TetS family tetracycline resistance ribosomal protection protein [Mumia zhuanghuii]